MSDTPLVAAREWGYATRCDAMRCDRGKYLNGEVFHGRYWDVMIIMIGVHGSCVVCPFWG